MPIPTEIKPDYSPKLTVPIVVGCCCLLLFGLLMAFAGLLQDSFNLPFNDKYPIPPAKLQEERSHAQGTFGFIFQLPKQAEQTIFAVRTYTVYENDRALPLPVQSRSDVDLNGHGRFCIKKRTVSFSSSDGSDPRTNGRQYVVSRPSTLSKSYWAMALGTIFLGFLGLVIFRPARCLLHTSLMDIRSRIPGVYETLRMNTASWVRSPWFAYSTILLLQGKVMWGIWNSRGLTTGDTSSYFESVVQWNKLGGVDIVWSPLYTTYFGLLHNIIQDPVVSTIMHRVGIVLVLAVLILALMRQLLPKAIAWFVTAWWVVLPINFNALYEVHLFAVIPLLVAFLLLRDNPGRLRRGCAIAVLFLDTILMRNEILLVLVGITLFSLIHEIWSWRRTQSNLFQTVGKCVLCYGLPLLFAGLVVLVFYVRSPVKYPEIRHSLNIKHTLNVSQIYSFGHGQRNPGYTDSPWVDYHNLMNETFGEPLLTMGHAFKNNPDAMMEHFLWNAALIPNGIQMLLFNRMWGTITPDYPIYPGRSVGALLGSAILLLLWLTGALLIWRERDWWWKHWFQKNMWIWLALVSVACTVAIVMIMQRPRPSYMFGLGLLMMAWTGVSIFALTRRLEGWKIWRTLAPAAMILLIACVPSYYLHWKDVEGLRLSETYRRLAPYKSFIKVDSGGVAVPVTDSQISFYLANTADPPDALLLEPMVKGAESEADAAEILEQQNVRVLYLDNRLLRDPLWAGFLQNCQLHGWAPLVISNFPKNKWTLLYRISSTARTKK